MQAPGPDYRGPFWRVFPWDAGANPGDPYTPQYILPAGVQTGGRFDLADTPTLYLALEDPAHALAEVLQSVRGRGLLRRAHLRRKVRGRAGRYLPLAVVDTWVSESLFATLPDLGDPENLLALGIRPDDLSSRNRLVTQRVSRRLHDEHGLAGFRWWSSFKGEWHVALLYMDRVTRDEIVYGTPDPLHLPHPLVAAAAAELRMRVERS